MKNYIDSPEHWEDSINAYYDNRERREQEQNREQPDEREQPGTTKTGCSDQKANPFPECPPKLRRYFEPQKRKEKP